MSTLTPEFECIAKARTIMSITNWRSIYLRFLYLLPVKIPQASTILQMPKGCLINSILDFFFLAFPCLVQTRRSWWSSSTVLNYYSSSPTGARHHIFRTGTVLPFQVQSPLWASSRFLTIIIGWSHVERSTSIKLCNFPRISKPSGAGRTSLPTLEVDPGALITYTRPWPWPQ